MAPASRTARRRYAAGLVLLLLVLGATAVALVVGRGGVARPEGPRDPALWPFTAGSPWNTPLGLGARFTGPGDPRQSDLARGVPSIAAGEYSQPVYLATRADPVRRIFDADHGRLLAIPRAARPAAGTDRHLNVVEPDRQHVDECFRAVVQASGDVSCDYYVRTSLTSTGVGAGGTRAYGGSAIGGLIRTDEVDAGYVPHALALALQYDQLRTGFVWPATDQDHDAATTYRGRIPMGSLLAIPATVDLRALRLSPGGLVLARALQDFGGYVVDHCSNVCLYAEPTAEGTSGLRQMRGDWGRLRGQLRVVVNSGPASIGGPGPRRRGPAPVLATAR